MAVVVSHPATAHALSPLVSRKRSHADMQNSTLKPPSRWIDEEIYRMTILSLYPSRTEREIDDKLQHDAQALGLLPLQESREASTVVSSMSATTVASEALQGSIMSQSTAPTSCASSERRPSTSLSHRSSKIGSHFEMPTIVTEMERKRHSGLRSGLRKIGFRKKRTSGSSTPSICSMRSEMTDTIANGSRVSPPTRDAASIDSGGSFSSHESAAAKENFELRTLTDEQALQRSMDCEQIMKIRSQQLEEKRRFLEYQTELVRQLLDKRDKLKNEKKEIYAKRLVEEDEKNEKAVEELEARQLEDELKQMKEHETEKRAIQTRLKHMEAYCQTPSPPSSPSQARFDRRSLDSINPLPERRVTQQHYENLAQAYHVRDNMDGLHISKINVLRGKQKLALQNFILKKEREMEQLEKEQQKELDSIDFEFGKQESEIRQEFEVKRLRLESRWKLEALIEKTRRERSTGLKYDLLPDVLIVES